MKKIITIFLIVSVGLAACKKNKNHAPYVFDNVSSNYVSQAIKYLKKYPLVINCDSIDFDNCRVMQEADYWYLRLAFKNKSVNTDFILLQTGPRGLVANGRIIHLEKKVTALPTSNKTAFNGSIVIKSFDGTVDINSAITGGYIESFHPLLNFSDDGKVANSIRQAVTAKAESFPVPAGQDLPEITIVAYTQGQSVDGELSWSDYMMLGSIFGNAGSGSSASGSSGTNGSAGNSGYNYGNYAPANNTTGPYQLTKDRTLSFDNSFYRPAINLEAWLKCFTNIPDAGATATITLCGDMPKDSDPTIGLDIWSGNTGHCFLEISKTNGAQSVTQVIGFTAQSAGAAILNTYAFVPSKIVDNAGHKYNCTISMPLTPGALNLVLSTIRTQAQVPYSVVHYDCLDFALDVFNSVRGPNPLKISKTYEANDPFSDIATGPKLFSLLSEMVDDGSPESSAITLAGARYAGVSHGPCN